MNVKKKKKGWIIFIVLLNTAQRAQWSLTDPLSKDIFLSLLFGSRGKS